MTHLRGCLLVLWTYLLMAIMGILCAPFAAFGPRRWTLGIMQTYVRLEFLGARLICGMRPEIRGPIPQGEVIIAAKHQSFLDIMMLTLALDRPRFVMKRSLVWAPVLGFYARRMGCVAVDRGAGGKALRDMVATAAADAEPGQLVIFPQGTRVAPGVVAPWKSGVAGLQEALALPVIPVATNAGHFWPRSGVARRPGAPVVAFLAPIPPGLPRAELMAELKARIEPASDALLAEARGEG